MQLTYKALTKITEFDLDVPTVMRVAASPSYTTPGRREGQRLHVRDGIVAVVAGSTVVTVYRQKNDDAPVPAPVSPAKAKSDRAVRDAKRAARRERDRAFTSSLKAGKGKK